MKRKFKLSWALFGGFIIIAIVLIGFRPNVFQTPAPDFTLNDIHGESVTLSDYQGKVVFLEFMATWCFFCMEETNELVKISQIYGSKVVIISVSVSPSHDTVTRLTEYIEAYAVTWTVCRDTKKVAQLYEIEAVPSHMLIDPEQNIRWRDKGWLSYGDLSDQIDRVLSD